MKKVFVATGVVAVLLGAAHYANKPIVAENVQTVIETVTQTVEVSELTKRIEDEQNAQRSDVEALARTAYEETYAQKMLEIELRVTSEYRAEIEKREVELEKEVGVY